MADPAPAPDAALVQGILNRVESAGDELFEKYSKRVYYLALRQLSSRADAEDVRAETFLRVVNAIRNQQVRSPDMIGSYILGAARHVILEAIRSPQRAASERDVPDVAAPEPDPELDEALRQAIESTILRLKPKEREFLRWYYYDNLTTEEIARRFGIDTGRLRVVKHRCLKSFREVYARIRKNSDTRIGKRSL